MILDLNSDGVTASEVHDFAEWPFSPPARDSVRDEVHVRGDATATLSATGTPDGATPSPPDRIYPLT